MRSRRGLIAHILPFEEIGGTELQTLRLAQAAETAGFENVMYCPFGASEVAELFRAESLRVEIFELVEPSYTQPLPFFRYSRDLARKFRADGVDVIHAADMKGAHHAGLAGRLAGARVLCHVRNSYPNVSVRERGFFLPVHEFVFVSEGVKKTLGLPPSRKNGPVIYDVPAANGSGLSRDRAAARERLGLPQDVQVVGTAARLAPQKDYDTLIRAARLVLDKLPGTRFLVAGDIESGEHRKYFDGLLPLMAETGTREAFHFAGFQNDMSWFYAASDAIVLSSHWEGLGTVLLEAMLNKKPVVATRIDGFTEIVMHEKTGLLSPPKSPAILADYLIRVLTDEPATRSMIEEGTRYFDARFSTQRFVKQIDELYGAQVAKSRTATVPAQLTQQ